MKLFLLPASEGRQQRKFCQSLFQVGSPSPLVSASNNQCQPRFAAASLYRRLTQAQITILIHFHVDHLFHVETAVRLDGKGSEQYTPSEERMCGLLQVRNGMAIARRTRPFHPHVYRKARPPSVCSAPRLTTTVIARSSRNLGSVSLTSPTTLLICFTSSQALSDASTRNHTLLQVRSHFPAWLHNNPLRLHVL